MPDGLISRDDGYDDENVSMTYSPDPSRNITLQINSVKTINNINKAKITFQNDLLCPSFDDLFEK